MNKLLPFVLSLSVLTVAAVAEELPRPTVLIVPSLIIFSLIILNGVYVAAEFAIVSVRPNQMEQLAEAGHPNAPQILETLRSPQNQNNYIATTQVGLTAIALILGMYAEAHLTPFLEPYLGYLIGSHLPSTQQHFLSALMIIALLTYLHVVLGEMLPKAVAVAMPDRSVLALAPVMQLTQTLIYYPVRWLNGLGLLLLKLMGVPPVEGYARLHSPEELELIVTESAEEGLLNEEEQEIILNIFNFGDRQVGQVMTPRRKIEAIPHNMPLPEIITFVTESKHSRFPVYQDSLDRKIIGILHINDLARHHIRHRIRPGRSTSILNEDKFDLRLLIRPAPVVPEQFPVDKLLNAFRRQRIHLAIVLDEFGGTAGVVTLEDLMEEVVGEVRDEFDLENEPYVELAPGIIEVSGRYLIEDLQDEIAFGPADELPDVETIGGLITSQLGRPPHINDTVTYNETIHFTVLTVDGLAVGRARVEFPVDKAEPESSSTEA